MLVALVVIGGGIALIAISMSGRQRMRELVMRERIALIEKGLAPSPEVDPAGFDRLLGGAPRRPGNARSIRYRSAGVMVMGLGAALLLLIGFTTGNGGVAFGVGGGLLLLGAATFVNGLVVARETPSSAPDWPVSPRTESGPSNPSV
jgi:hypothetical protein